MAGTDEFEVLGGGPEGEETASAWRNCAKNPGHTKFIPASSFSQQDLPEEVQDEYFYRVIQTIARLTVRLRVNCQCPVPPDDPSASDHLSKVRTGTGFLFHVMPHPEKSEEYPDKDCWYVKVLTACHVVNRSEAAKCTKVDLYFDDEDSRRDGRMKILQGTKVLNTLYEKDYCELQCVTHDKALATELKRLCFQFETVKGSRSTINRVFKTGLPTKKRDTVVVVSYPHGRPKQVTVGYSTDFGEDGAAKTPEEEVANDLTMYYNTDTCPGSSGALILTPRNPMSLFVHIRGGEPLGWNRGCSYSQYAICWLTNPLG